MAPHPLLTHAIRWLLARPEALLELVAAPGFGLDHDVVHVGLNGALGEEQLLRDRAVVFALNDHR